MEFFSDEPTSKRAADIGSSIDRNQVAVFVGADRQAFAPTEVPYLTFLRFDLGLSNPVGDDPTETREFRLLIVGDGFGVLVLDIRGGDLDVATFEKHSRGVFGCGTWQDVAQADHAVDKVHDQVLSMGFGLHPGSIQSHPTALVIWVSTW